MRAGIFICGLGFALLIASCGSGEQEHRDDTAIDSVGGQLPPPPVSVDTPPPRDTGEEVVHIVNNGISCVLVAGDDEGYDRPPFFGDTTNALLPVYLNQHIQYPDSLRQTGITGVVKLQVSIDKTGKVVGVSVRRGIHPVIDKACADAVLAMPAWKPAVKNGGPVSANIVLPVTISNP